LRALSYLAVVLYGLTSLVYLAYLFNRSDKIRRGGRYMIALVLVVHLATIGSFCVKGLHPLLGISGLLNLMALMLMGAFLVVGTKWKLPVAGAAIVPLSLALVIAGQLTPRGPPAGVLPQVMGKLHLTLVAIGVTALALAAAVAVVYLRQNLALRKNRLAALDSSAPALITLDTLSLRLTLVGAPLFFLAVVTGVLWSAQLPGGGLRLEHLLAGVILLIYLVLLLARLTIGMRGRRAAILTLAGFGITVAVLAMYVARRLFP